jgi:DnaJ domain
MDGIGQRDLYGILGVAPEASDAAIRHAYRTLARRYHPDLHPDAKDDEFRALAAAYRVLGDGGRRRAYDRECRGPGRIGGPTPERRAPAPGGHREPRRDVQTDASVTATSPPTDEWRILSRVGTVLIAAVLAAIIIVAAAALVLGGDHAILTLPGGSSDQMCQTPDGWVDCHILDATTP